MSGVCRLPTCAGWLELLLNEACFSCEPSSYNFACGRSSSTMRCAWLHMRRCWNYSTRVGQDASHPQLCERCAPVIRGMGFELPSSGNGVASAPAQEAAVHL